MSSAKQTIDSLYRLRPRNIWAERAWWLLATVFIVPWFIYDLNFLQLLDEQRRSNAKRFLGELVPYPIQQHGYSTRQLLDWLNEHLADRGWVAVKYTLAVSLLSIFGAGLIALCLSQFASRRQQLAELEELQRGDFSHSWHRRVFVFLSRSVALFLRAIPEYVWGFVLVMVLGVSPWPAILALALHNGGILAKLYSEAFEDVPAAPLAALRGIGLKPMQIGFLAALPYTLNRLLLYFFVRWETCVRESTVIGFLGIVSLGYWVEDARSRTFYDQMFLFILLGVVLVLIGDVLSTALRAYIRNM